MVKSGRQVSPTLDGIRDDHVRRYQFAASYLSKCGAHMVVDAGCGVGYGSMILAQRGFKVHSYDADPEAVSYAEQYYGSTRIQYHIANLTHVMLPEVDAIIAFEVVEHFTEASVFLRNAQGRAKYLLVSAPNQDSMPFEKTKHKYHVRHYTLEQLQELIEGAGWRVTEQGSQGGKHAAAALVRMGKTDGKTLIMVATC